MTESRKRIRSDDDDSGLQMKFYVTERLANQKNGKVMQGIYQKTLGALFAGANIKNDKLVNKAGNANNSMEVDTIDDKMPNSQGCMLCWKDIDGSLNIACKNCNLEACSTCQTNCVGCAARLCNNCVNIFGCSVGENPVCEYCKPYVN